MGTGYLCGVGKWCSNANPRLLFMWYKHKTNEKKAFLWNARVWLINNCKMCAACRWEFERTSWGLDSQSQPVKWELLEEPGNPGLPVGNGMGWDFMCYRPPECAALCWQEVFLIPCRLWGFWGSRVFPELWHGFLLPIGMHKWMGKLKMK